MKQRFGSALRVFAVLLLAGCADKSPTGAGSPQGGGAGGVEGAAMHVRRGMDLRKIENDLDQIGKFYIQYSTEKGSSPASLDEFKSFISREAPVLVKSIEEGKYEIVWKVKLSSNTVIAYEKDVDMNGNQRVVMGDGSVKPMRAQELQTALQIKE